MAGNLKSRLERIRSQGTVSKKNVERSSPVQGLVAPFPPPWVALSPLVLVRKTCIPLNELGIHTQYRMLLRSVPEEFLTILFRKMSYSTGPFSEANLLFFDLETTGLSGGAGTLAFLAAFGEMSGSHLEIRQYLLLDYPGEPVFIEYINQELHNKDDTVLVSYNGKAFDIQILRSRFILQGQCLPDKDHIDLLYVSRLLWGGLVPSCSQSALESLVLRKERHEDIPGALAPHIWFSFLREGPQCKALKDILSVCNHNLLDIQGLVTLFNLIVQIGTDPLAALGGQNFNVDRLALAWPKGTIRRVLLIEASRRGSERALYELARLARMEKDWDAYRRRLEQILELAPQTTTNIRLRASIGLASYYEWKKGDLVMAEWYTRRALDLLEAVNAGGLMTGAKMPPSSINIKLEKRLERILIKQQQLR